MNNIMTEQPTRIEGGISDATRQYLKSLNIIRERIKYAIHSKKTPSAKGVTGNNSVSGGK